MHRGNILHGATRATLIAAGLLVAPGTVAVAATIPAFPGADGAAANVSGGRAGASGGIVYHVTRTNSAIDDPQRNDPGTIRYGLNNANFPSGVPRTIVFDVGGVFHLGRLPQPASGWDPNGNGWDPQSRLTIGGSNVTLAGQTAPGAGVIFMGGGLKPQGNNNIIRNVTVASGYGLTGWWKPGDPHPGVPGAPGTTTDPSQWFPDNTVYDAMDIAGTNLMIDHVSTLFATDETISMNEVANNITVQYSSISQGLNYPQWDAEGGGLTGHALGSLLEAGSTTAQAAISFHHNLYAHHKGRTPQLQAGNLGAYYDFRNNVFYNWMGTAGSKGGTTFLNLASNFYLAGDGGDNPIGGTNPGMTTASGGTGVLGTSSSVYRVGNLLDGNKDADANDGVALSAGGAANPLWRGGVATYFGITDSAAVAYSRVLDYMGANWQNRSATDARIVNEVRTGTGKVIGWADDPFNNDPNEGVEWRTLKNTPQVSRAIDWDTEFDIGYGRGDGMPTWWEILHGLNPMARDDAGDFDGDGYTNLEEYLNEIAEWPAPVALVFDNSNATGRFEEIHNWHIPWQPSKYDEARILSGNVTINSVGQHARVLKVAPDAGNNAVVTLSAGWIDIAERLEVANAGQFIITGGALLVPAVQLSGDARLALTPGGNKHLKVQSLTINGNAKLDVGDNKLIVASGDAGSWNGSAYTGIAGLVNAGRIVTMMPDASAETPLTALAVARAGDIGKTTFAGQSVDPDDVLVMYTYRGDANLDGKINIDDYGRIDGNVSQSGSVFGWSNGDFNYDGKINIDDYGIIDGNINQQGAVFSGSLVAVNAVPEPACMMAISLTALLVRRRRHAVS
jgi:hypothetical protein